ncbi:NAD(P)H-dependent oxidoreductase [Serratia marcescens]
MNVLIVYAHPEPLSLTGSLKNFAVERLTQAGHQVQLSDLYAMKWKATLDADDSLEGPATARFDPSLDSQRAFANGMQSADIAREQQKLRWADAVLLQFPLWWFSMPAILKGWVERVYAYGFAYGVGEHSDTHWGDRYGEGTLAGKRAMLIVTYRAGKTDEARFAALCEQLGQRLDNLWNAEPIRFRRQNAGDYLIPQLTLKAHLAPGQDGFGVHIE